MDFVKVTQTEMEDKGFIAEKLLPDGVISYYAVEEDGIRKGYLQTEEDDDELHLQMLFVPHEYREMGYATFLVNQFAEQIADEDRDIIASYDPNDVYSDAVEKLLSRNGFRIDLFPVNETTVEFDEIIKRTGTSMKSSGSKEFIIPLGEVSAAPLLSIWENESARDALAGFEDMTFADPKRSFVAINKNGEIGGVLLAERGRKDVMHITSLWAGDADVTILKSMFSIAPRILVENNNEPRIVEFSIVNEKLQKLIKSLFPGAVQTNRLLAEAQFDMGLYESQKALYETMNGGNR